MQRGSPAPPPDRRAARLRSLGLLGEVHWRQLEHLELRRALRPRNHEPPAECADALENARHVALRIVAISERLVLVSKRQAPKEDEPRRIIVFPQPPGGPLASRLLDDGQLADFDLDVAEERLEAFERLRLRGRLAERDQPAIVAARRWR